MRIGDLSKSRAKAETARMSLQLLQLRQLLPEATGCANDEVALCSLVEKHCCKMHSSKDLIFPLLVSVEV